MTSRTPTRVLRLLAIGALATIAASCGSSGPPGTAGPTTTTGPTTSAPTTTAPTSTTASGVSAFRIYLMRGDKLAVAGRTAPATPAVATAAMTALLAGPTQAESSAGLSSTIPAGTALRSVSIKDGTATVDLSSTFSSGGGSLSMTARLAQVTFTLTQFPSVSGVVFRLDGTPVTVFGGEGIVLDHPATRAGFESVAPAILVESPTPGAALNGSLRVWGTANVFEAQFRLEVVDSSGRVLADQPVRATSGTGTRGTFDVTVSMSPSAGPVTLNVFNVSAKDGSRQDQVSVPLQMKGTR